MENLCNDDLSSSRDVLANISVFHQKCPACGAGNFMSLEQDVKVINEPCVVCGFIFPRTNKMRWQ